MNTLPTTSKSIPKNDFEDEDIFDDSTFLANFEDSSFKKQSGSAINNSANKSALNVSALCCDEELSGYDKLTGTTWIYPTNYPVRDYQFNIIKAAILKNTLVSLPTGLGKTFIAAVIMYNFYRWYPLGKIVFTAPTRPLIAQQIEACYNIIAIPPDDTIEMTGHMQANTRKNHWLNKRVFFATPQVIYNDIKSGICPSDLIRCLVIDEAHRARKNYAYCQIVSCLDDIGHKIYRLLALSATPGSRVEDVISVINSLHIAHLELRTEECIDVAPYSHSRNVNTVIVQLGPELTQLRNDYVEIIDGYARRLKQLNILPQNLGNLSKGRIVMLYKEFQSKDRSSRHPQHNYIMKDFTNLISLFHGLELLLKHGSRVFLNFFEEHPEKTWIQADYKLSVLLERLRDNLGINPLSLNTSVLPDGTIPEIPKDIRFGHPKFDRLKEIMTEHFNTAKRKGQDTRAIVFCEYRESVNLVHCLLLQCRPLIIPQTFVGQGASGKDGKTIVSQKQQLRVMKSFRAGACNTLVATCVAEEGLDVGSVDLILCFDISNRSPIRLVQRCGRTGRERSGQVHILVTEGREHQTLMECMRQRDGLNKKILQSKEVERSLYKCNPRMIPNDFMPKCEKMHITVAKKNDTKAKGSTANIDKKGQKDLRAMLLDKGVASSKTTNQVIESNQLTKAEFDELFPQGFVETNYLEPAKEYLALNKDSLKKIKQDVGHLKLYSWIDWQRSSQKTFTVGHSTDADIMSEILKYSDTKRFEMESLTQKQNTNTQVLLSQNFLSPIKPTNVQFSSPRKTIPGMLSSPTKSKVSKKKQKAQTKSPSKNNGDIRALFSTATKSTKNYTKLITDLGIPNDGSVPTRMVNLLVDLNVDNNNINKICYVCTNYFDCTLIKNMKKKKMESPMYLQFLKNPILPDINLIKDFNADLILKCGLKDKVMNNTCGVENKDVESTHNKTCTGNFDLELDFDLSNELVSSEYLSEPGVEDAQAPYSADINEMFAEDDIVEEATKKKDTSKVEEAQDTLKFFGLDSIEDIFADYDDSSELIPDNKTELVENNNSTTNNVNNLKNNKDPYAPKTPSQNTPSLEHSHSPSILSGNIASANPVTSPILCSQTRRFQLSTKKKNQPDNSTPSIKAKKRLTLEQTVDTNNSINHREKTKTNFMKNPQLDTSNKSMLSITQLVEMINKTEDSFDNSKEKKESTSKHADERSVSPILFTQADKKKSSFATTSKVNSSQNACKLDGSLIVLDSDSDSNDTVIYDFKSEINKSGSKIIADNNSSCGTSPIKEDSILAFHKNKISPPVNKRKLEIDESNDSINSPYFNKKQKIENHGSKQLSMQEKILFALKSDNSNMFKNDRTALHFTVSQPNSSSQKENSNPQCSKKYNTEENNTKDKLKMLQMYRREKNIKENVRNKNQSLFKNITQELNTAHKRRIEFDDSDDDFIIEDKSIFRSQKTVNSNDKSSTTTNHKVRKKRKKGNSFLDLEAEESDDSNSRTGDELSDDSIGSIVDFICDENITHHEDMHAHYVKSVRSPLKGGFKIPELPKIFNKADILSQYVEEDEYEMDSFCVDSHVGLTQVNEVSELELAEMILKQKKKSKKNWKSREITQHNDDDSPVIKRKNKNAKRQIHSDSDDSS